MFEIFIYVLRKKLYLNFNVIKPVDKRKKRNKKKHTAVLDM